MEFTFNNQKQFWQTTRHLMRSNCVINVINQLLVIEKAGETKRF